MDERDDAFLPSSGYHVKMSQEVAGLGGDVFFGKTDLQSSFYLPLPAGWVRVPPSLSQPIPPLSLPLSLSQPIPSLSLSTHPLSLSLHSITLSSSLPVYLHEPPVQVFCLSLWGGVLRPYSNNHLVDRFLLGGGTTLRGFGMWGVGPRDRGTYTMHMFTM